MAQRIPHLLEREGRYYARVVIPKPLRSLFAGRWEMSNPLGPDRREAVRRLPGAVAEIQTQLEAARAQLKTVYRIKVQPRPGKPLTDRQMAAQHYGTELALDDADRAAYATDLPPADMSAFRPGYEAALRKVVSGKATNDEMAAAVGWIIDAMRENGHTDVERGTEKWRALARTMAGVQLEVFQRQSERDHGRDDALPQHPALAPIKPPEADPLVARMLDGESNQTLSEIFKRYSGERKATPATTQECEVAIRMFEEQLGQSKPLYRITRQDVQGFKRALLETPIHYRKRFPGKTLPQAIAANKKRKTPYETLVARTINNKILSRIHALLEWCVKNDLIPDNPAAKISVDFVQSAEPSRLPFSGDDLKLIFPPAMFQKELGEFEWAMLISLYGGMRTSELAQIKLSSIRHERGVLVFDIEEKTKNAGSKRIVPVHSELIRRGLDKRIAELKAAGETHLFPKWYGDGMKAKQAATEYGTASLNQYFPRFIPRKFNRDYLPKLGIGDRKVWHSLRHTFKTQLSRGGVDKATRDYLTGHVDGSAGAVYVHDVSVEAMAKAIEKIAFEFSSNQQKAA